MNSKNKLLFMTFLFINFVIGDIPSYSAKYTFESDEISISGVRSFKSDLNGSEIKFEASNLLANLFFSSKFKIINGEVIPETYDIKIKPKFLNRDQSILFDQVKTEISSTGSNEWISTYKEGNQIYDPLNVQIVIRSLVKQELKSFNLNLVNMEVGGFKNYIFKYIRNEKCDFDEKTLNCLIYERTQLDSNRKVTYYLAEELEYMFIRIIDSDEETTNRLTLEEILSFG